MKALIILLTGPLMVFFVLAVCQTIEWCTDNGVRVPPLAWVLLTFVAIWGISAYRCGAESLKEACRQWEQFLDEFFK
jgi:hypothetical protein